MFREDSLPEYGKGVGTMNSYLKNRKVIASGDVGSNSLELKAMKWGL